MNIAFTYIRNKFVNNIIMLRRNLKIALEIIFKSRIPNGLKVRRTIPYL